MENKKLIKSFCIVVACLVVLTLLLSVFYNTAFISSNMLMLALFLFSICYYVKDEKRQLMYLLFILGVLLIIGSLIYTYLRLV